MIIYSQQPQQNLCYVIGHAVFSCLFCLFWGHVENPSDTINLSPAKPTDIPIHEWALTCKMAETINNIRSETQIKTSWNLTQM